MLGMGINSGDVAKVAQNTPLALERAAEAVKPGFQPLPGERVGSSVGEAVAYGGLTAPLASIAPARPLVQSLVGAATGGSMSALSDASEEGMFHPKRTVANAAVGGLLPLLSSEGLKTAGAKVAGALGKIQSGVPSKFGERLYKDPGAFLSPSENAAAKELVAFREGAGLKKVPESVKEIVSPEASEARSYVTKIAEQFELAKLGRAKPVTGSQLLKAKQSLKKIIEATPIKQSQARQELFELKEKITETLEKAAPGDRGESLKYSRSALASKFRKVLPVTAQGDISLTRTLFLPSIQDSFPAGAGTVVVGGLQSPFLGGSAISAAGGAHTLGQAVLKNPVSRQAIQSELQGVVKTLTKEKAKELIKQAPGDTIEEKRTNARKMAKEQNYTWPRKK
jgi:hypothetical protein